MGFEVQVTAVKEVVEESETTKQEKIIVSKTEEVKQELVEDSKTTESIDSVEAALSTKVETLSEKGALGLKEVLNKEQKVSSEVVVQSDKSVEVVKPKAKKIEPGQITVTVHKAQDIEKKGMFGKADPYVIMTFGDQKAKSKTIKNNYNPEWEFTANFNIQQETPEGITISLFDDDIGKDDALGSKVLDIGAVQEYKELKNQWIPLENCKSGEVLVSAEFTPQTLIEKSEKSIDSKSTGDQDVGQAESKEKENIIVKDPKIVETSVIKETAQEKDLDVTKDVSKPESKEEENINVKDQKVLETSVITETALVKELDVAVVSTPVEEQKHIVEAGHVILTVHKARDIEKKGMFGKADPYVNITFGKQKAKSKTVNNNHNPEWNFNATFEVDQNTTETIRIEVFDEDLGKDDTLGHKVMDINSVVKQKKLLNQWVPLDNCKSGEILLSAEFIPIADIQKSKQIEKPEASEASLQKSEDIEKSLAPKPLKDDLKQIEPKTQESFEVPVTAVKRLWRNQKQLNRKR